MTHATDSGYFYPGEAARILGIPEIRYNALRAIYNLVRQQRGAPVESGRKWARFSMRDLAGALEVIRICVDRDALQSHDETRILLARLERACMRLRRQGLSDPLLQSRLEVTNGNVIATVNGVTFDTSSGQLVIEETLELVQGYLVRLDLDEVLLTALERERLHVVQNAVSNSLSIAVDETRQVAAPKLRRVS